MPRPISGIRVARSFVTPSGAAAVSRELDFQLAVRQGIEMFGVIGTAQLTHTFVTAVTVIRGVQTLHLETGTLEEPPTATGEDEDNIDTEIIYQQVVSGFTQDEAATRGGSLGALLAVPSSIVAFPFSILSARNITHRGESENANLDIQFGLLIYYRYVEFSLSEMGLLLARRS